MNDFAPTADVTQPVNIFLPAFFYARIAFAVWAFPSYSCNLQQTLMSLMKV